MAGVIAGSVLVVVMTSAVFEDGGNKVTTTYLPGVAVEQCLATARQIQQIGPFKANCVEVPAPPAK